MIAVIILSVLLAATLFLLAVAVYRVLQYQNVINFMASDITSGIEYLTKLTQTHTFSNSPEVLSARSGFLDLASKLTHYQNVVSNKTIRDNIRGIKPPPDRRPVSID